MPRLVLYVLDNGLPTSRKFSGTGLTADIVEIVSLTEWHRQRMHEGLKVTGEPENACHGEVKVSRSHAEVQIALVPGEPYQSLIITLKPTINTPRDSRLENSKNFGSLQCSLSFVLRRNVYGAHLHLSQFAVAYQPH